MMASDTRGGLPRLRRETPAEFGRGIVAGEHEQIVKSRNRLPEPHAGEPLVQTVEECA